MNIETWRFNTDLNGLKTAINDGWIEYVVLSDNRTNMALISLPFLQCHHFNGCNSHNKPRQAGAWLNEGQS